MHIFMMVLMLCMSIEAYSYKKEVRLNYSLDDFEIELNLHRQVVVQSKVIPLTFPSDSTKATLPYLAVNVLMPSGAEYEGLVADSSVDVLYSDVNLPPLPENYSGDNAVVENVPIRDSNPNSTNSADLVTFTGQDTYRGCTIFHFLIRPFNYVNRQLSINSKISFEINYQQGECDSGILHRKLDLDQLVINPEDLEEYNINAYKSVGLDSSDLLDYAIITTNEFKDEFQPLVDWKNIKGIKAEMFFVEDIYAEFSQESSNQMKIKKFIKKLYDERDVCYVLLDGDDTILPYQGVYSEASVKEPGVNESSIINEHIATDLFYASMDYPLDWDTNNNGDFGDINDRFSIMPSVYVTRATVRVSKAAEIFVNKIISYERYPDKTAWKNDIVMTGMNMFKSDKIDSCGRKGTEIRGDKIYEKYIEPYWSGKKLKLYETYSDFDFSRFTNSSIEKVFAGGHNFINWFTHGIASFISTESGELYGDEIFKFENNFPTIVTSGACDVLGIGFSGNQYNFGACTLMSPSNNVIAFYGATENTIYSTSNNEILISGVPEVIGNFYKTLFSINPNFRQLGSVYTNSKMYLMNSCNEYCSNRWNLLSMNIIGDPEMPVYIDLPKEFSNVKIGITKHQNDSKYTVKLNSGVSNYDVCISDYENGKYNILKTAYVINNSNSTEFISENKTVTICFTKPGYIPYVVVFNPTCLYLQNETLTEGCVYMSPVIEVGENVTSTKNAGKVIFKSNSKGSYLLRAKNIKMERGAVIEPGAIVKMEFADI